MNYLKMLGLAAAGAMALMAFAAGSASATTLEVEGVAQNVSVSPILTLKSGTSMIIKDTFGVSFNTCTASELKASTASPFTGETVTGAVSTLAFSSCTREPIRTHKGGTLHVKWIASTNATVTSSEAEWTTGSPFGTLTCKTGAGTHLGALTGVKTGNAMLDINAALSCSGVSMKWEATYTVTSPSGLGVVA
jgi:hypothetical protein